ncbi:hypothetical protein N0V90_008588 [Kalmusia sp. IMI 367209]|nr:hypothetical protein N0V90_008588 [Kalmusia sp. IMI 367209]
MASSHESPPGSSGADAADARSRRRRLSAGAVGAMSDEDLDDFQILLKDPRASSTNGRPTPTFYLPEAIKERVAKEDHGIVNAILRKDESLRSAAVTAAIKSGSLDMVKSLISLPDINRYEYMHIASIAGKLDIVKWLVANGASTKLKRETNKRGLREISPAQAAAYYGQKEVLDYLIDLDLQNPQEWQSLFHDMFLYKFEAPHPGVVQVLCKRRARYMDALVDVNLPNDLGKTVFHNAPKVNNKFSKTMLRQLLECGANPFARDRTGTTPWDIISRLERHDSYVTYDDFGLNEDDIHTFMQRYWDRTPDIYMWRFSEDGPGFSERLRIDKKAKEAIFPSGDNHWLCIQENNIPYFHSKLKSSILDIREDLEEGRHFLDQESREYMQLSEPEKEKRANIILQSKRIRSLNIHLPRTLDESYYLGMSAKQLQERNKDQVLSHDEEDAENKRVLMVSQLWLWRMDNIVVSACARKHAIGETIYGKNRVDEPFLDKDLDWDPHTWAMFNFQENNLYKGRDMSGLQITALVFSEFINSLDGPNYAGLQESVFHVFEKAVANVYDQVKSYMKENTLDQIDIRKEMKFLHQITDIRDELAMIKNVITDQAEVWTQFYEDLKDEIPKWDDNNRRIAIRPKEQIPKFNRRVQKIDEDAQRVEQWIQGQLDLKKTHASLRESHNSTVLSTTVIGFTIITIVFTPLSFMASLLAVPDDNFGWLNQKKYAGKVFMTVAEVVSLLATLGLVYLCLWWLKRRETLANEAGDTSQVKDNMTERQENKLPVQMDTGKSESVDARRTSKAEKPWLLGFRKRSKRAAADLEQSIPHE